MVQWLGHRTCVQEISQEVVDLNLGHITYHIEILSKLFIQLCLCCLSLQCDTNYRAVLSACSVLLE